MVTAETIGLIKLATEHRKSVGPSGNLAEMLKVTGEEGVELARQLTEEAVINCGVIPADGGIELHSEPL